MKASQRKAGVLLEQNRAGAKEARRLDSVPRAGARFGPAMQSANGPREGLNPLPRLTQQAFYNSASSFRPEPRTRAHRKKACRND
jgi:hypothetical protein